MPYRNYSSTSASTYFVDPHMNHDHPTEPRPDAPVPTEAMVSSFISLYALNRDWFNNLEDLVMAGYDPALDTNQESTCDCLDCRQARKKSIADAYMESEGQNNRYKFSHSIDQLPGMLPYDRPEDFGKFDVRVELPWRYRIYRFTDNESHDFTPPVYRYAYTPPIRYIGQLLLKKCDKCHEYLYTKLTPSHTNRAIYIIPMENGETQHWCVRCYTQHYTECQNCGMVSLTLDEDGFSRFSNHDDLMICPDCDEQYFETCAECDRRIHRDNAHWVEEDDLYYCGSCYEERYISCGFCGHDFSNGESGVDTPEDGWVCDSCFEANYQECPSCQRVIRTARGREADYEGTTTWLCRDCVGEGGELIRNHSYKPRPRFLKIRSEASELKSPGETLFMGFELEVENIHGRIDNDMMCATLNKYFKDSKNECFAYFKRDGSLANGFEIVSHPMSWGWFLANRQFLTRMLALLKDKGFRSWNTPSCGLHIHMNKTAFNGQRLYKFMKFFHENGDFLYTISCRKSYDELRQWARLDDRGASKSNLAYEAKHKMKREGGRYWAVNLEPQNTIEIRIFKGTLNENSFLRAFEFLRSLYLFTGNGVATIAKTNVGEYLTFSKTLPEVEFPCLKHTLTSRKFVRGNAYKDTEGD